ncbi:leucine-rich_repeat domain-containing protein [Hexamita inflata]|uniref:Leucine-rich repeat domain-containing protein n=1 Tax=Hexamita inflata TaxID=28002 RepID=A0AA86UVB3_9EUKA|nr:leucine-rich repeat domain-containing protein [Hexamita inflata]
MQENVKHAYLSKEVESSYENNMYNSYHRKVKDQTLKISSSQDLKTLRFADALDLIGLEIYSCKNVDLQNSPLKLNQLKITKSRLSILNGIEKAKELLILNLEVNQIVNIQSIGMLNQITELYLSGNAIIDISPIRNLNKVKKLHIGKNYIINIEPLKRCNYLEELNLEENQINDISALYNKNQIKMLNLSWNNIVDITPISDMIDIQTINLYHNYIVYISALKKLSNIKFLHLNSNFIQNLEPINTHTFKQEYNAQYQSNPPAQHIYFANKLKAIGNNCKIEYRNKRFNVHKIKIQLQKNAICTKMLTISNLSLQLCQMALMFFNDDGCQ